MSRLAEAVAAALFAFALGVPAAAADHDGERPPLTALARGFLVCSDRISEDAARVADEFARNVTRELNETSHEAKCWLTDAFPVNHASECFAVSWVGMRGWCPVVV